MVRRLARKLDLKAYVPKLVICLRQGYTRSIFIKDFFAGVTVGIVALPLALAFAIASGVAPERGLFTAIVAGFLISALGGSRVQIGGPTGAFVVIVYGVVQHHGYQGLVLATLMAGLLLICMGLARLGAVLKFIPYPVVTGFTTGIALIIFTSQIKDFFGLATGILPADFLAKWWTYLRCLPTWNPNATAIALGSLLILLFFRRWFPRLPGAIVAVTVGAACVRVLHLPVATIGSVFGTLPRVLPHPALPVITLAEVRTLVPEAFTIALLAGIESLLSAVVADGMIGTRHKSNCELVAQGVANIASAVLGGIPATGAIARTATNIKAGARTPVAGIIHAATLLMCMFFLAPLASMIPLASLAAVLVLVAWNMSEIDHFIHLLRAPRGDVLVMLSVFGLTVLVDLTTAVQVGVVMAAMLFMKRMSDVTHIGGGILEEAMTDEEMHLDTEATRHKHVPPGVEVYEIDGPFFFGVADLLRDVLGHIEKPPRVFLLRMRHVPMMDASGIHALEQLQAKCRRQGTALVLSGVRAPVHRVLDQFGLTAEIGPDNVCSNIDHALKRAGDLAGRALKSI